jgi:hypothetical protein
VGWRARSRAAWRPREGRKGCRRGRRSGGFYRRRGAMKSAGDQPNQGERKSLLGESSPAKFLAGVRDDTRAPLVREREAEDILVRKIIRGGPQAASVTRPNRCPGPFLIFLSSFLLFLFLFSISFISFQILSKLLQTNL